MRHFSDYRTPSIYSSYKIRRKLKPRRNLSNNTMILDNFPRSMIYKDMLYRYEYFGQYGNAIKIDIFPINDISVSLGVSFAKPSEASLAILALNDFSINGFKLKAKFDAPLQREKLYNRFNLKYKLDENKLNKEHQLLAIKLADIYNKNIQQNILRQCMNKRTVFPSPLTIFSRNKIVLESGYNPLQKAKPNKSNRSRFDFVTEDDTEELYSEDKESKYDETPKFISSFIQRTYELSYKIKGITSNFNFLLLCQTYNNKFIKGNSIGKNNTIKENKAEKEWFDFLYDNFTEENKDFYKEIYEKEQPKKEMSNWAMLESPRDDDEFEYQKDFDGISEGVIYQVSTEESEFSEN